MEFTSPHDARERIETVYQDLAVAPQLDAVANIFLGRERRMTGLLGRLGFLDQQRMQGRPANSWRTCTCGSRTRPSP